MQISDKCYRSKSTCWAGMVSDRLRFCTGPPRALMVTWVVTKRGLQTNAGQRILSDPQDRKELALEWKSTALWNILFSSSDIFLMQAFLNEGSSELNYILP